MRRKLILMLKQICNLHLLLKLFVTTVLYWSIAVINEKNLCRND